MEPMQPLKPFGAMKPLDSLKPMEPIGATRGTAESWWPSDLGQPSTSGSQNGMRYAFFPDKHRLLIERDGKVTIYDSGDHRISGVFQTSTGGQPPTFSSPDGPLELDELTRVAPRV